MPYRKRHVGRRMVHRKYGGKKLTKRQKHQVKSIIGRSSEVKYWTYGFGLSNVTNSPGITNIMAIPQGVADGQRVGDNVRLKKLKMEFQLVSGDIYNTCRVMIIQYHSNQATAPVLADIFDVSATGAEYVMCPVPAQQKEKKVKILYDSVHILPQTYASTSAGAAGALIPTSASVKHWKKTLYGKKLGSKQLRYDPGSTNISNGSIWIVYTSDSGGITHPQLYFNMRAEYTDT